MRTGKETQSMAKEIKDKDALKELAQKKSNLAEEHRFQSRLLQYLREESERLQTQVLQVKSNIKKIEEDYKANDEAIKSLETVEEQPKQPSNKQ